MAISVIEISLKPNKEDVEALESFAKAFKELAKTMSTLFEKIETDCYELEKAIKALKNKR